MWEVLIQLKQGLTANLLACLLPVCFKHMTILKYYLLTGVMDVEPFINGAQEVVCELYGNEIPEMPATAERRWKK